MMFDFWLISYIKFFILLLFLVNIIKSFTCLKNREHSTLDVPLCMHGVLVVNLYYITDNNTIISCAHKYPA